MVAHKCAQHNDELGRIAIASRNISKCQAIIDSVKAKGSLKQPAEIKAYALNALDIEATKALIRETESQIVINVGSAFLNMSVLRACIDTGVAYLDTAIHEEPGKICETPPWYGNYEWKHLEECQQKNITAILGVGFDPGVVNAYAALAQQEHFDRIDSIDILDVNAGSHGKYFATNFDPEINFREFTGQVWSWQDSQWTSNTMFEVKRTDDLPVVGSQNLYLTGHDEVHSLSKNLDVPNVRFWMSFGEHYINVFTVLRNLGLLSEQPVKTAEGWKWCRSKWSRPCCLTRPPWPRATPARPASVTWSRAARMASRAKSSSTTWPTTKKPTPRPTAGHFLHRRRTARGRRPAGGPWRVGRAAHGQRRGTAGQAVPQGVGPDGPADPHQGRTGRPPMGRQGLMH